MKTCEFLTIVILVLPLAPVPNAADPVQVDPLDALVYEDPVRFCHSQV